MTRQEWFNGMVAHGKLTEYRLAQIEDIEKSAMLVCVRIHEDVTEFSIGERNYTVVTFTPGQSLPEILFSTKIDDKWVNQSHTFIEVIGTELKNLVFLIRT